MQILCLKASFNSYHQSPSIKKSMLRYHCFIRTVIIDTRAFKDLRWSMAENQETGRKRQKMSKVWDHFKLRKEDNMVQCMYCKTDLAHHNNTSSMLQHLTKKHPHVNVNSSPCRASTIRVSAGFNKFNLRLFKAFL